MENPEIVKDNKSRAKRIAKGAGRVVAAGIVGATMGFGADQGGVRSAEAQFSPFGSKPTATATLNPTEAALATRQAAADARSTAIAKEAAIIQQEKENVAAQATNVAARATSTPTPTSTRTPAPTSTSTLTAEEVGTQIAGEQAKVRTLAAQATVEKQLADAKAAQTAIADEINLTRGTPTRAATRTVTATLNPTAAAEAKRLEALGRRQAEIQGTATADAAATATAKAPTATSTSTPTRTPVPAPTAAPGGGGEGKISGQERALSAGGSLAIIYSLYRLFARRVKGNWGIRGVGPGVWNKIKGWVGGIK